MDDNEFLKQQFIALRAEIQASKSRALWIVMVGIFLVVAAAYLSTVKPRIFASAAIPFSLLMLILAYTVEQNGIIRAGRYIRDHIEPAFKNEKGWEDWLSSNTAFREVDRYFFFGFIVIFLAFYSISCTVSLEMFKDLNYSWVAKSAGYTFGGGFLFVVLVLFRHWRTLSPK